MNEFEIVDTKVAQILRRKSPAERLDLASKMRESVLETLQVFLRSQHPQWSDEQVRAEIARRMPRENQ